MINEAFDSCYPVAIALGWTILYSLWQAILVVFGCYGWSKIIPGQMVITKYWVLMAGLVAQLIWSIMTFIEVFSWSVGMPISSDEANQLPAEILTNVPLLAPTTMEAKWMDIWLGGFDPYLPYVSIIWVLGVLMASIYLVIGWFRLQALKGKNQVGLPPEWAIQLDRWRRALGITQQVVCYLSHHVQSPVTFFWLKPIILLPVGLFSGLTPRQIEVLLLHELAHIRRNDFLINLLQSCIEVLFFYHPAIWWLGNRIRETREFCCDDIVIRMEKDPYLYAETLTQIPFNQYSLPKKLIMTAKQKPGLLSRRIFRLLGSDYKPSYRSGMPLILCLCVGLWLAFRPALTIKTPSPQEQVYQETQHTVPKDQLPAIIYSRNNDTLVEIGRYYTEAIDTTPTQQQEENSLNKGQETLIGSNGKGSEENPLYIIDGKEAAGKLEVESLDPNQILSINVMKGKAANAIYGTKGNNGVILIRTKANASLGAPASILDKKIDHPLYFVDGKVMEGEFDDKSLDPDQILTIEEIDPIAATALYGKGGENGAVLIQTKSMGVPSKLQPPLLLEPAVVEQLKTEAIKLHEEHSKLNETMTKIKQDSLRPIDLKELELKLAALEHTKALVSQQIDELHQKKTLYIEEQKQIIKGKAKEYEAKAKKYKAEMEALEKQIIQYEFEAYPNPATDRITISFQLPDPAAVSLDIYTMEGKLVSNIIKEELSIGPHQYDWNASSVQNGSYLVKIKIGDHTIQRPIVVQ